MVFGWGVEYEVRLLYSVEVCFWHTQRDVIHLANVTPPEYLMSFYDLLSQIIFHKQKKRQNVASYLSLFFLLWALTVKYTLTIINAKAKT